MITAAPHTPDLFHSPPDVVANKGPISYRVLATLALKRSPDSFDRSFCSWLTSNWQIWNDFCRLADRLRARDRNHYSAQALFHYLRLETDLRERSPGRSVPLLKVNNNHSAQCARLFNSLSEDRADFFKTRNR